MACDSGAYFMGVSRQGNTDSGEDLRDWELQAFSKQATDMHFFFFSELCPLTVLWHFGRVTLLNQPHR